MDDGRLPVLLAEVDDGRFESAMIELQLSLAELSSDHELSQLLDRLAFTQAEQWHESWSLAKALAELDLAVDIIDWHEQLQAAIRHSLVSTLRSRDPISNQIGAWKALGDALFPAELDAQIAATGNALAAQGESSIARILGRRYKPALRKAPTAQLTEWLGSDDWHAIARCHTLWRSPDLLSRFVEQRLAEHHG
jgi:hypothetical protein